MRYIEIIHQEEHSLEGGGAGGANVPQAGHQLSDVPIYTEGVRELCAAGKTMGNRLENFVLGKTEGMVQCLQAMPLF